jgi:ArpU family phage transcriptional regulator
MQATRQNVEDVLEVARIYKHLGFIRRESRVTRYQQENEPRFHGKYYQGSSCVEAVAVHNADGESRMKQVSEDVDRAINCLPEKQQEIILRRYLNSLEEGLDYQVCSVVHLSEHTYRHAQPGYSIGDRRVAA